MEPLALTIEQTAEQLQLHPNSVRKLVRLRTLRAARIGRCWRIPCSEVLRILGGEADAVSRAVSSAYRTETPKARRGNVRPSDRR